MFIVRTRYFRIGLRKHKWGSLQTYYYLDFPFFTIHWSSK